MSLFTADRGHNYVLRPHGVSLISCARQTVTARAVVCAGSVAGEKIMRTISMSVAVAVVSCVLTSGIVFAEDREEVRVQATRLLSTKTKIVGQTSSGVPVVDMSLSYGVSTAGLDLASSAGAAELTRRVKDAAHAACREISRQYPEIASGDAECARSTADKAMVQVQQLIAVAQKSPGK
jgi:UrcA family protein